MLKPKCLDEHLASVAESCQGAGILILEANGRLDYMNRRSWDLLREIHAAQGGTTPGANTSIPPAVMQLCAEFGKFHGQSSSHGWGHIELRRLAGNPLRPVYLRGFGLPAANRHQSPRILVLMEQPDAQEVSLPLAVARFRLTDREGSVVRGLAKGWTNKEIAVALQITEPTVKAHLRNIMDKTQCTTRTAVAVQCLNAGYLLPHESV